MVETEYSVARWKIALYLAGSLAFVAIALFFLQHPNEMRHPDEGAWKMQLGLGFFGLCSVVFVGLLIRPQRLLLDRQGFTLVGGLIRSPKTVAWRDIEPFFVYRLPRGGKMIGYNYREGVREDTAMRRLGRALAADGVLPKGWPMSPEKMVAELNGYRERALGGGSTGPATSGPAVLGRVPTVSR